MGAGVENMKWFSYSNVIWTLVLIVVFALVVYGMLWFYNKYVYHRMLSHLSLKENKANDIFYISMRHKKVYSESAFSIFGIHSKRKEKVFAIMKLSQIVGYDFLRQYEEEMNNHESVFVHDFTLTVQGKIYEYVEEGYIQGKKIVSRIYQI